MANGEIGGVCCNMKQAGVKALMSMFLMIATCFGLLAATGGGVDPLNERLTKETLLEFHSRLNNFDLRMKQLEHRHEEIQSYSAGQRIDFLKGHLDFALGLFGLLTIALSIWNGVSIAKIQTLKTSLKDLQRRAGDIEKMLSRAKNSVEEVNASHMKYNARIFHSLANVFELLSDSMIFDDKTLDEVITNSRAAYLQTVVLYYEQAIRYNLDSKSNEDLFSPVHNLAAVMQRIESREFSKVRHHLKSRLLLNHKWLYSADEIEAALKKTTCSAKEIATALTSYKKLINDYGGGVLDRS